MGRVSMLSKIWLFSFIGISVALEPITLSIGTAVLGSALMGAINDRTVCRVMECCDRHSISIDGKNVTVLQEVLRKSIYGQHIAQDMIIRAIDGHFKTENPQKALTISLHGTTGSGKSYMSQFIAESLFKLGFKSRFVKKFVGGVHFSSKSQSAVDLYKISLQHDLLEMVGRCERSLFIFEDVSTMSSDLLNAVKPFLDYHSEVQGVDFRKTIFIFISNTGQGLINKITFELWRKGVQREDIKLREYEPILRQGAYNEEGGWYNSEIIKASLIDHHIPFLPLEQIHVKSCIEDEFKKFGYTSVPLGAEEKILEEMVFFPDDEQIFSTTGCKRVAPKVSSFVHGERFNLL